MEERNDPKDLVASEFDITEVNQQTTRVHVLKKFYCSSRAC